MRRETIKRNDGRRDFLRGLALAGGVAAMAGSATASTPAGAVKTEAAGRTGGYRLTRHVAKYYDKARF